MSNDRISFPPGFLWGTATSAHQVEGNNDNNDWWTFERLPGAIWRNGRSGLACDWWRNAEADFDRMVELNHDTHRLSIEWSRVEPREGEWNERAVARYREMLTGLRERGIEPMVTLHHFSTPLWLARQEGWSNPAAIAYFRRWASKAVEFFGDLVNLWCTINEPAVYAALGHLFGVHAPGAQGLRNYFLVLRNLLKGHATAYRAIHSLDGRARVGLVKSLQLFDPADPASPPDRFWAWFFDHAFNQIPLRAIQDGKLRPPLGLGLSPHGPLIDSSDFIGLNYYTRSMVAFAPGNGESLGVRRFPKPGAEVSDFGRHGTYGEVYPEGMYRALIRVARLGKPIYVTETGLPDADDDQRPRFLITHLAQVARAIADGADVRGFYHWSLLDNFEWAEGWALRFGLIALDEKTQERTVRPSGRLFAAIAAGNGLTREMVEEYAPEVLEAVFGDEGAGSLKC
jgi:beta-glucosidase